MGILTGLSILFMIGGVAAEGVMAGKVTKKTDEAVEINKKTALKGMIANFTGESISTVSHWASLIHVQ